MHLKFKANNIYGHGTGNETREIVTNEVSLLSVFCWHYPIIQFKKKAQTEVTINYTENALVFWFSMFSFWTAVHAVRRLNILTRGLSWNCLWNLFLIVTPGAWFYICSSYISRQNQESWELHDKLPITWLGLQFWKLCGEVGRSPASV